LNLTRTMQTNFKFAMAGMKFHSNIDNK